MRGAPLGKFWGGLEGKSWEEGQLQKLLYTKNKKIRTQLNRTLPLKNRSLDQERSVMDGDQACPRKKKSEGKNLCGKKIRFREVRKKGTQDPLRKMER